MTNLARAVPKATLVAASFLLGACMGGGGSSGGGLPAGGLATSAGAGGGSGSPTAQIPPSNGPPVVVDDGLLSKIPSPFPDDRFTILDPALPTGRRLDPPFTGATALERRFRDELARLDGFGVHAAISVRFQRPLDPNTITDDAVLVVNVDPASPRRGEIASLDLGRGSYPTDLGKPRVFYPRDPLAGTGDMLYPPGNPGPHYEASSNTLVLRPLRPLAEGATHAVVLTDRLLGALGDTVSPPPGFARSTAHDGLLLPALRARGLDAQSIRFAWTFTTGNPTAELRAIADGLDGAGPFAHLGATFPPQLERFDDLGTTLQDGSPYTLDAGVLGDAIGALHALATLLAPLDPALADLDALLGMVDVSCLGYVAFGSVRAADLRTSADQTFALDLATGSAPARWGRVTFMLTVPRPCAENGYRQPPYPLLVFGHGNSGSRIQGLGIVAAASRHGWAVLAHDAVGHGPEPALTELPQALGQAVRKTPWLEYALRPALAALGIALHAPVNVFASVDQQIRTVLSQGLLRPLFVDGRATDLDGDGIPDSGESFFTADVFQTRDIIRQTVVDDMSLIRCFRGFGQDRNGNGRLDVEEGDLNQDGVLDVGGPSQAVAYAGISLGGILGSILAGADPLVARASLMVPGGGMIDIVGNSSLSSVTRRVYRDVFGVVVVGTPAAGGTASVSVAGSGGTVGGLPTDPGGRIDAVNLSSGGDGTAAVAADGGFVVHVAADPGDGIELTSLGAAGGVLGTAVFVSPVRGLGLGRGSPTLRAWTSFAELGLEPADPVAYAPLWRTPPAGRAPKDVLMQLSLGDFTVPVFTGVALARAAGLVSQTRNDQLIRDGVLLGGARVNVDRVYGVESVSGAGVRILGVHGHAGMLVPNPSSLFDGARYVTAAQEQAFEFLATGRINDGFAIFDVILPPF